jgi:hypothetical protein
MPPKRSMPNPCSDPKIDLKGENNNDLLNNLLDAKALQLLISRYDFALSQHYPDNLRATISIELPREAPKALDPASTRISHLDTIDDTRASTNESLDDPL